MPHTAAGTGSVVGRAQVAPPRPAEPDAPPWSLVAAIRDRAAADPFRVALVGDDGPLTYGELWARARALAERLVGGGERRAQPPGVVGVPGRHAPGTVVSLLGVWLAGGTYCPLDPAYPVEHVDAMLTQVRGRPLAELDTGHVLAPAGAALGPEIAYVLFTSGSTGQPKPVAVPHRALAAVVPALRVLFDLEPRDRVLQFASLSWDTVFEELLPTLAVGASVVFGADAHTGSFPRLLRLVERAGVTMLNLPTAVWHELVLHLSESGVGLPPTVRLVVIGGEAVDAGRLEQWRGLPGADRIRLLNTYGATETALITHAVDLHGPRAEPVRPEAAGERPPIGRPLGHVRQRIVDGELLVGGPSLASGYPGRPEETAERFVVLGGERWFRTGDLVQEVGRGVLRHRGRADAQVKVRGIRVDPGEVEAHLLRHPTVAAAAVTGVTLAGRTALAAYVVAAPGDPDGLVARLRDFLRRHAPAHLHPALLTVVPELVLTGSGKVDRRGTHHRYGSPAAAGAATD